MRNQRLQDALDRAGLTDDQLADLVVVDAKTVGRWLSGRTPHPRTRDRVARALGLTAHELWPDAETPPPASEDEESAEAGERSGDVDGVYPGADHPDIPTVGGLIQTATTHVDLLDLTLDAVIADPEARALLRARADAGVQVRLLFSDPDSAYLLACEHEHELRSEFAQRSALAWQARRIIGYLQPLLAHPNVQARTYVAAPACAITRGDDRMLVRLHLYGAPAQVEPVLMLTVRSRIGVYARYARHFTHLWELASRPVLADAERYPDPDQHPDRYTLTPAGQFSVRSAAFAAHLDPVEDGVSPRSSIAPTSWLKRRR